MSKETAIVKYKSKVKDIAKIRAERRLTEFKTVMSRLNQSYYYSGAFAIGGGFGLVSLYIFFDLLCANLFDTYTYFVFSNPGLAVFLALSSFAMMFLSLVANKISLRERLKREELKKLEQEEIGVMAAKKICQMNPESTELKSAYENLVEDVKRRRDFDEEAD